jgi:hypothetical protein
MQERSAEIYACAVVWPKLKLATAGGAGAFCANGLLPALYLPKLEAGLVLEGEDDLDEPGRPLRGLMLDKQRVGGLHLSLAFALPNEQLSPCAVGPLLCRVDITSIVSSTPSYLPAPPCPSFTYGDVFSCSLTRLVKVGQRELQSRIASPVFWTSMSMCRVSGRKCESEISRIYQNSFPSRLLIDATIQYYFCQKSQSNLKTISFHLELYFYALSVAELAFSTDPCKFTDPKSFSRRRCSQGGSSSVTAAQRIPQRSRHISLVP